MQTQQLSNYQPDDAILDRYAHVLVNFALGNDEGIAKGELVQVAVPDIAKPLAKALQKTILQAGGHPMIRLLPTGMDADFYQYAQDHQLSFFPKKYLKAKADIIDHAISIIADPDPSELKNVDPQAIFKARNAQKEYRDWLVNKEQQNRFTWTVALWGVQAKAELVGLSLEEYWQQIINACFLDKEDPISHWQDVKKLQTQIRNRLNEMPIEWLHIFGNDVDLHVQLGPERIWKGGADRNIPSFELFSSPNWRGTHGYMKFNQPLYRYGNILEGIELHFDHGLVVKAKAKSGQKVLDEMLKTPNANKLGEVSLTDKRLSRITHPMAETLYDENIGGEFGNSHVAIGMAYRDCYRFDVTQVKKKDWAKMGYNDSAEHTDIVSTTNRQVEATLSDGTKKIIYADGQFVI